MNLSVQLKWKRVYGTNYIVKLTCDFHTTENACNNVGGTEGVCFRVVATDKASVSCRIKTCAIIPNGILTAAGTENDKFCFE